MRLLPMVFLAGIVCGAPNGSAVAAENAAKSPQNRGSEAQLAYASGLIDDGLFDAALQSLRSLPPVSYTHLTLPTIYSV